MRNILNYTILLPLLVLCSCIDTFISMNGCDLRPYTTCEDVHLEKLPLNWQNLEGSNFTGANLTRSNLSNSNFKNAILDGANLNNANIDHVNFTGARCINTTWVDGSKKTGLCDDLTKCYNLYDIPAGMTFTQKDITKKYRELAKKYHPDKSGNRAQFELVRQCKEKLERAAI